jgi:hypothetical protein
MRGLHLTAVRRLLAALRADAKAPHLAGGAINHSTGNDFGDEIAGSREQASSLAESETARESSGKV